MNLGISIPDATSWTGGVRGGLIGQKETKMDEIFEVWAIVELFGHQKIAGKVTEQTIAGQGFLRVDVPEIPTIHTRPAKKGFVRMYGPGAIYSITPVSEEIAVHMARTILVDQVGAYLMPSLMLEAEKILEGDYESGGPDWDDDMDDDEEER